MCLNASVFVHVLSLAHTYILISALIMACIFTYIHKYFRCLLVGRGEAKEKNDRREGSVKRGWKKNCFSQNDFFFFLLLILTNFILTKGLFDVNMKCLFRGEFYWVMMMIKMMIKIIITLLLFISIGLFRKIFHADECIKHEI